MMTCKHCGFMMVWGLIQLFMVFYDFSKKFKDFINIHEYANKIIASPSRGLRNMLNVQFGTNFSSQ